VTVAALVVAASGVVLFLVAVVRLRSARRAVRHLRDLTVRRMGESPASTRGAADEGRGVAGALRALERDLATLDARRADDRAERDLLSDAHQALPIGVIVTDAAGEILNRNRMAARYVGARHADAIVEATIPELVAAALAAEDPDPDPDQDGHLRRELALVGPPRRVLDVRARAIGTGVRRGAVVTIRDITDIRRVEQVRRDFVANVSHELKTPIGALAVLADTLAEEDDPQTSRQLAGHLAEEAERLGRIVHDLLDLSVLEALDELPREPVPLGALAEEALARVRSAAALREIDLIAAPTPDATLFVDRPRLVSALFNLLDNAVKYSDPGSTVRFEVLAGPGVVTFAVHDRGCGIPARDRERVFERFYRVDRARARATGGTGLGLAFVRHVAEAHGGRVWVDSEEGVGSTFRLALPR
jgi:two-component system, OmpR family, sensor histidine kinase SenX3